MERPLPADTRSRGPRRNRTHRRKPGETWGKRGPTRNPTKERSDHVNGSTKDDDLRKMINLRTQEYEADRKNLGETRAKTSETEGRATLEDTHNRRTSLINEVLIVEHPPTGAPTLRTEPSAPYHRKNNERREKNHSYQTNREVHNEYRRLGSYCRRQSNDRRPVDEPRQSKVLTPPPQVVPSPP